MAQHFGDQDKNRSIFRKHIRRALLAEEDHPYLARWELDVTSAADREKNSPLIDEEFEKSIERRVTAYIHDNFTYCTIAVESKEDREYWKSKIVSTLAQVENVAPSEDWLGHHAPSRAIRSSGLWHVQNLNGEPLTSKEFADLERIVAG